MMWGYTMFPPDSHQTHYISRIEDKNGNVPARFDTEEKKSSAEYRLYHVPHDAGNG
jgi:penicillin-binding protein 1A